MKTTFICIFLLFATLTAKAQVFNYAGSQSPVSASYFGLTCGHPGSDSPACIPIGTARTWDVSISGHGVDWEEIDAGMSCGTYTWTTLDAIVTSLQSFNVPDTIYTVGYVPQCDSATPSGTGCAGGNGACYPNSSTTNFVAFMNAITQRYCGKIQYWEGWNEANSSSQWNNTIPLLVTYMHAMYTAVHSTSNCACVGTFNSTNCAPAKSSGVNLNQMLLPALSSPALFTHTELNNGSAGYNINLTYWLTQYLADGGGSWYDIAATHSYGSNGTCYAGPEVYVTDIANFKQVFATANANPQVWATELNWGQNSCISDTDAVMDSWIARYLYLHWAIRVQRAIWYAYGGSFVSGGFGTLVTGSNQVLTYQEMQKVMVGAVEQNCQQFSNSNWTCSLTRVVPSGYAATAVWNSTGSGSYTVHAGITQYRDVLGNITATTSGSVISLTASPLLFETKSAF